MSGPRFGRRSFLLRTSATVTTSCAAARAPSGRPKAPREGPVAPVVIASSNGHPRTVALALEKILAGTPVVEAVVEGVALVEDDPNDVSVGYGGIPNEDGVVELDASVMDGASGLAGAVAALRDIKNPSRVALAVLRQTDHCLLVGEGALRFARAHGFPEQNLLTDRAREVWLYWKSTLSDRDDWLPKDPTKVSPEVLELLREFDLTGTINCCAIDPDGNLAGVTTTSGLAFKIPGRVGDSPLIGAGLFVDNAVGAAGSTGRGEANIVSAGSATVVEAMRRGQHPKDACLEAARRVVETTKVERLRRPDGRPDFNVKWYAIDKQGRYGCAAIWAGGQFAVADARGARLEDGAFLFEPGAPAKDPSIP